MVEETYLSATKQLGINGKEKLFDAIEKYIELKIENRITPATDEICDKLEKAEETLKNMIIALEIRLR